uniref:Ovule protein n=1 Tax=Acrobeloides nanus TaxID=290746 RepID=A0A914EEI9_9BILA
MSSHLSLGIPSRCIGSFLNLVASSQGVFCDSAKSINLLNHKVHGNPNPSNDLNPDCSTPFISSSRISSPM